MALPWSYGGWRSAEFMSALQGGRTAFEVSYLPDFTPIVTPLMIQAGIGILERKITAQLEKAIGNPSYLVQDSRSTGSLIDSIRVSNTFFRDNATRFFANVFFDGYDKRGMRQGEKAAYINFGTGANSKRGGPYRPRRFKGHDVSTGSTHRTQFASKASRAARPQIMAAMQAVLERELKFENTPG